MSITLHFNYTLKVHNILLKKLQMTKLLTYILVYDNMYFKKTIYWKNSKLQTNMFYLKYFVVYKMFN